MTRAHPDWLTRYPHVQRLLDTDGAALDYYPEREGPLLPPIPLVRETVGDRLLRVGFLLICAMTLVVVGGLPVALAWRAAHFVR